ncbi:isochorismatase family protein, partial [Halomonas sp. SIMBA_159]
HHKGVTTVIIGGLATDYCVKTTALQLQATKSFKVIVNLSACRGISPDHHCRELQSNEIRGNSAGKQFRRCKAVMLC